MLIEISLELMRLAGDYRDEVLDLYGLSRGKDLLVEAVGSFSV